MIIRDNYGRMIGRTEVSGGAILVYDSNGVYMGRAVNGKTYNSNGVMVAMGEVPGILIKSEKIMRQLPNKISKGGPGSGRKKTNRAQSLIGNEINDLRKDAEHYRDQRDHYEKKNDTRAVKDYKEKIDNTEFKIHKLQQKLKNVGN